MGVLHGKQEQVGIFICVRHDAKSEEGARLANHHDIGVGILYRPGYALAPPPPRQALFYVVARHQGDVGGIVQCGKTDGYVGKHGCCFKCGRLVAESWLKTSLPSLSPYSVWRRFARGALRSRDIETGKALLACERYSL
jgi:hypothetical protein